MNSFKLVLLCLLAVGLGACRKKSDAVAKEVREAGYNMTAEGWFDVIRSDDVQVMKKMVGGGFDDKTKGSNGMNGLHIAAESGSIDAAGYLLNRGHSVDVKSSEGKTPLMIAVLADRPEMVRWFLRQGANPKLKDNEGFMALMLAVTNDRSDAIEELATYNREDLDSAVLLASLVGHPKVIDTLTNYGASVYARMEDGRTPLMLAAQNGHSEAVAILMDIGASRFATTENGDTAQSFAVSAGHDEIAAMIEKGFGGQALALESEEEVAEAMEVYIADFQPGSEELAGADSLASNETGEPLSGSSASPGGYGGEVEAGAALLGATDVNDSALSSAPRKFPQYAAVTTLEGARVSNPVQQQIVETPSGAAPTVDSQGELPLVMRHYRQRELPVEVRKISGDIASLRLAGMEPTEIDVRAGEPIPGSKLVVVRVHSRIETGKLQDNQSVEVGVIEVEDRDTGQRREWIAGRPASSHDPVALVEDAITGQRYIAQPGQKFFSEDGREFIVNDVRPSQLVIEDTTSGEVRTIRLRGPKG